MMVFISAETCSTSTTDKILSKRSLWTTILSILVYSHNGMSNLSSFLWQGLIEKEVQVCAA